MAKQRLPARIAATPVRRQLDAPVKSLHPPVKVSG